MDACVVFVVRTVAWNVKWHEGRKDLNSTKMDQRGKTPDRPKKKKKEKTHTGGHGCLSLVCVVCCQVEVSATGWSLVQRSPTECGVSECYPGTLTMRRPCQPWKQTNWKITWLFCTSMLTLILVPPTHYLKNFWKLWRNVWYLISTQVDVFCKLSCKSQQYSYINRLRPSGYFIYHHV
jgi:hypothetical protein